MSIASMRGTTICVALSFASCALATEAVQITSISGLDNSGTLSFGWQFYVNSTIYATKLGYFDYQGNGLAISHEVAIFEADGTPVAAATVGAGTSAPLEGGHFRYVSIAPVQLTAGTQYLIYGSSDVLGSDWYTRDTWATMSFAPEVAPVANGGNFNGWGGNPGSTPGHVTVYAGPNFQFSANPVPEPATLGLAGLALAGAARRRLRHRA